MHEKANWAMSIVSSAELQQQWKQKCIQVRHVMDKSSRHNMPLHCVGLAKRTCNGKKHRTMRQNVLPSLIDTSVSVNERVQKELTYLLGSANDKMLVSLNQTFPVAQNADSHSASPLQPETRSALCEKAIAVSCETIQLLN